MRYANKRAEMWGYMKEWCKVGCLPDDRDLRADLTNVEYGYDKSDAILLERKRDMRRRGLASPDDGDALALTFAYPVERRNYQQESAHPGEAGRPETADCMRVPRDALQHRPQTKRGRSKLRPRETVADVVGRIS